MWAPELIGWGWVVQKVLHTVGRYYLQGRSANTKPHWSAQDKNNSFSSALAIVNFIDNFTKISSSTALMLLIVIRVQITWKQDAVSCYYVMFKIQKEVLTSFWIVFFFGSFWIVLAEKRVGQRRMAASRRTIQQPQDPHRQGWVCNCTTRMLASRFLVLTEHTTRPVFKFNSICKMSAMTLLFKRFFPAQTYLTHSKKYFRLCNTG